MGHIHYFKKSYEIEQKFYERYSDEISHHESNCKIPKCFGSSQNGAQVGYHDFFHIEIGISDTIVRGDSMILAFRASGQSSKSIQKPLNH